MEVFLAFFAAVGIVATVYFFFGALFCKAAARRVVTVVETRADRDVAMLCAMWVSSFLVGGETLLLPRDREKLERLFPRTEEE